MTRQQQRQAKPRKPRAPMPPGREARPPRPVRTDVLLAPPSAGRAIIGASWAGTALLLVTAVAADLAPHPFGLPGLVVAVGLFVGGMVTFLWAYAIAVSRSREEEISILGVYGLSASAPPAVRLQLFGSLAAEAAIALVTASTRLYSSLSFGVLAVLWGVGLTGLWGAKHGAFPPRAPRPAGRRRSR